MELHVYNEACQTLLWPHFLREVSMGDLLYPVVPGDTRGGVYIDRCISPLTACIRVLPLVKEMVNFD